jgi:integrase/recombinase XerD
MIISDAIKLYLQYDHERGLVQSTIKLHHALFKRFSQFCRLYKLSDIRDVASQHLLDYAVWVKNQKTIGNQVLHHNYGNDHIRLAKNLFQLLFERQLILCDVTKKLPELHDIEYEPRGVMNPEQIAAILRQPNVTTPTGFRDRTILELLYASALRAGELCRLSIYDLDLTGKTLRVVKGKGGKDRIVPISKVAGRYLSEYLEKVRPIFEAKRRKSTKSIMLDTVFLNVFAEPLDLRGLYCIIRKHRDNAGLPADITTHSFRHTCAVEMLKGGASIRHVQELLGHTEMTTTQIYTRLVPLELKKVHDKTAPSERGKVPNIHFDPDNAKWITPKRTRRRRKR